MGLYSSMSLDELSVLKKWLETRMEDIRTQDPIEADAADRIEQLEQQLREVEAEIGSNAKLA